VDLEHFEIRHDRRDGVLATASLACPACDAPVVPPWRMLVTERLSCPFCGERGLVRDFLSLEAPARPARVTVRVGAGLRVPSVRG
jgi:hypothetical protein